MKRVFALLLCAALALALALPAGAEDLGGFLYPLTYSDETALCLVGAPAGEGKVTVTVNGAPFSDVTVTTAREAGLGITYYCMVDQSSSFSLDQKNQQLRGLNALSDSLRPQDSMILVIMGNSLTFGEAMTDPEARKQAVEEACVYQSYSTALYDNIIATVQTAAQDSEKLSCVVLFTDGLDNTQREGGREQVEQAIRDSGVSFNAVSVMTPTNDQFVLNNARQMVLFAQESLGGIGIIPAVDKEDASTNVEDAVADIVNQVLSSSVVRLDAALLPREGNPEVTVAWELEGNTRESSVQADVSLLPPLPTEPETTAPETTVPETTQATEPQTVETTAPAAPRPASSNRGNVLMLLAMICFAGVVILTVVAVVLLLRQRGRQEEPTELEFMEDAGQAISQSTSAADIKLDFSGLDHPKKANDLPDPSRTVMVPTCRVRLVPEGNDQGSVEFTIEANDSVTLGRNSKAQIILNETDTALSGLHFELQWDSWVLYLRDRRSTNGTALNGTPLRPESWTRVENKSVIQAGATKYTVFVEKK